MDDSTERSWTYTPTDLERIYLTESLGQFFEEEWLIDILYKVRVGKEATCYCCKAHPDTGQNLVAAKVYRPDAFRAMRNDWYYRMGTNMSTGGRGVAHRGRVQRAMKKHTRFGKKVERISWSNNEFDLLNRFFYLGAAVPKPLAKSERAILMEYFGDEIRSAPTLQMVALEPSEARELFDLVIGNVSLMLKEFIVHADLSAHNILYWNGDARIIDMPQAVRVDRHPGAFDLLSRDVDRVCQYFRKQKVICDPIALSIDLWQRLQGGSL